MAGRCCTCGRLLGGWTTEYGFSHDLMSLSVCDKCHNNLIFDDIAYSEETAMFLQEKLDAGTCATDVREIIKSKITELRENAIKHDATVTQVKEKFEQIRDFPVTTTDIDSPYDIIGPIIYNTTNKGVSGVVSSAYEKLKIKYSDKPFCYLLKTPKEKSVETSILQRAAGQRDFDDAFYICVAEMKLRCVEMGGNAIVGFRMDFDLDTTNYSSFYLQVYGTAVKIKD